ncbi:MAG: cytidylate kinase family protein [Candidatus Diapherotrites archaeon]|nr:cytidylate kinase family protein [Candidatus Diapherotrites archaeon]
MIITVSGKPGSGKSSLAKALAEKLGLEHHSSGDFMREIARERGISLLELSRQAESDEKIDHIIDERTRELGEWKTDFVMDSRLAWHFIPQAVKVFLDVSIEEAAKRIYKELRVEEKENTSLQETRENIRKRQESENKRYQSLYRINQFDKKNFDIIIDTSKLNQKQVLEKALKEIKKFSEKRK